MFVITTQYLFPSSDSTPAGARNQHRKTHPASSQNSPRVWMCIARVERKRAAEASSLSFCGSPVSMTACDWAKASSVGSNDGDCWRRILRNSLKMARIDSRAERKGSDTGERLGVVEELLQDVCARQDGEVVVQPSGGRVVVGGEQVPAGADGGPDVVVLDVVGLDDHAVAGQVAEALDPRVAEGGHRLEEDAEEAVRVADERKHVLERERQAQAQDLEEAVDAVPPHAGRHGVLGGQVAKSRASRWVL